MYLLVFVLHIYINIKAKVKVKAKEEPYKEKLIPIQKNQRFFVETITMTTVTERRIVREATEDVTGTGGGAGAAGALDPTMVPPALPAKPNSMTATGSGNSENFDEEKPPPIPPKESSPTQISGILKGGKLWKQDSITQVNSYLIFLYTCT